METIRRQLITLLSNEEMNVRELSQALGIMEKEVYDHLKHIKLSVKAQKKRLITNPSRCNSCGFIFKDRTRVKSPGKCPRCRKTYIRGPAFSIA